MALLKKYWLIVILLVWVVAWYALSDDRPTADDADAADVDRVELPSEPVTDATMETAPADPEASAPEGPAVPVDGVSEATATDADVSAPEVQAAPVDVIPDADVGASAASEAPVTSEPAVEAVSSASTPEAAMTSGADPVATRPETASETPQRAPARDGDSSVATSRDEPRAARPAPVAPAASPARPSAFIVGDVIREARSLYWSEGIDAAIFVLERALARPELSDRDRARLLAELGDAYFAAGRFDHARTAYRSSVLQLPPSERAMMERRYRHQGRW